MNPLAPAFKPPNSPTRASHGVPESPLSMNTVTPDLKRLNFPIRRSPSIITSPPISASHEIPEFPLNLNPQAPLAAFSQRVRASRPWLYTALQNAANNSQPNSDKSSDVISHADSDDSFYDDLFFSRFFIEKIREFEWRFHNATTYNRQDIWWISQINTYLEEGTDTPEITSALPNSTGDKLEVLAAFQEVLDGVPLKIRKYNMDGKRVVPWEIPDDEEIDWDFECPPEFRQSHERYLQNPEYQHRPDVSGLPLPDLTEIEDDQEDPGPSEASDLWNNEPLQTDVRVLSRRRIKSTGDALHDLRNRDCQLQRRSSHENERNQWF